MQILYIIITFISISTISFPQNQWGGISVSMPDNLDAISGNPAGLGINRGEQIGNYFHFDRLLTSASSYRSDGFGVNITYNKYSHGIFNPKNGNIAFGTCIYKNLYSGIKWNKKHFIDIGILYRPINQISLGTTIKFKDDLKKYYETTLGFSARPFFKHRLSIGADITTEEGIDSLSIYPHLALELLDGLLISGRSNMSFDEFQINMAFSLENKTIYTPAPTKSKNNYPRGSYGIGFYSDTQIKESIFNKKQKNKQKYIRLKLDGLFIEEKPYEPPFSFNLNPFAKKINKGTQLRTWINDINELGIDENIDGIIIDLGFVRAGWAKRLEIHNALKSFKANNKKIIVYAEKGISNVDYHLIAMADEIYINHSTRIGLKGLSWQINFYKELLDTLSIITEVVRVNSEGKSYKTAMDPYIRKNMSNEMKENFSEILKDLNKIFIKGISLRFSNDEMKTQNIINNGPYFLNENIINNNLADSVMYADQFEDYIKSINDKNIEIIKWEKITTSENYIHEWSPKQKDQIALIYAVGTIMPGKSNPGPAGSSRMGHETIQKAIKSARENEDIKAIVLRIDSPGGSVYASDQMWREIIISTDEDSLNRKPFIASMSDVAASGGYYIAMQADTIVASPATITGSIGVFSFRPNFSKLTKRFGINTEWIKEGKHSDFYSSARLYNNYEKNKIQKSVDRMYSDFKDKIIYGRENINKGDNLDQVAMGRVFIGERAKNKIPFSLVDVTGSFNDAISIAKTAAGISLEDDIEIIEYPNPKESISKAFDKINSNVYNSPLIKDLLLEGLSDELELLELLSSMSKDEFQMLMPYILNIE